MSNYRLIIQYDGTRYHGWQRQKSGADTIQGKIESALGKMAGSPVMIDGAGRTDAGVHARAQVANFRLTEKQIVHLREQCQGAAFVESHSVSDLIFSGLNAYLPEDIRILKAEPAGERFHSRLNATGKIYEYRITKKDCYNVFMRKYSWQMEETLDVHAMEEAAACLLGKHDFKGFCSKSSKKKSTVRNLQQLTIFETANDIVLRFEGDGFLHNMVRIITGTLVEIGAGRRTRESVLAALNTGERAMAGATAPAKGLTLCEVHYM